MPNSIIVQYACGHALTLSIRRIETEETLSSDLFAVHMLLSGTAQVTMGSELFIAHADDVFSAEAQTDCRCLGAGCSLVSIGFDQHFSSARCQIQGIRTFFATVQCSVTPPLMTLCDV